MCGGLGGLIERGKNAHVKLCFRKLLEECTGTFCSKALALNAPLSGQGSNGGSLFVFTPLFPDVLNSAHRFFLVSQN